MAKKLAITIAGAVSLGSYEAGVLYEIIRTIKHHNTIEQDESKKIEIDVLVGASAGGMSATIAAQKLLFEASSLDEPYDNSFYHAWVQDVSFDKLINFQKGDDPTHSILSSNLIDDISKKHVDDCYAGTGKQPKKHSAAADTLWLGLALSNLNGVDYVRSLITGGYFCYTRFQDRMIKIFDSGKPGDVWVDIRNAAVSCGAFPFAFRVKDLNRQFKESENKSKSIHPIPNGIFKESKQTFTYTDGGVFENEPLGMAKDLVDKLDPTHSLHDERFYLFVSPQSLKGHSNPNFNEKNADFFNTAKAIIPAIYHQARFHDWITAEQVNDQIKILDQRAKGLSEAIIANKINSTQLQNLSTNLLPLLFGDDQKSQAKQTEEQNRLRIQYKKEYSDLTQNCGLSAANIFIDIILVLETAADLGEKDDMKIFGITAEDDDLAGGKLTAFLGFFDQSYRDHDYDVGRKKAQEFIKGQGKSWFPHYPGNNQQVKSEPWMEIHPILEKLNGSKLKLTDVPEDLRKKFKERLSNSANIFLSEMGIPRLGRIVIKFFFIKHQLNKLLGL